MKTFRVLNHPNLGYQAVKVGFSWPGFLFSVIWLLIKKLWRHAIVVVCSIVLLTLIEIFFNNSETSMMVLLVELGLYVLVGANGNEWRMTLLISQGFELVDTLQAKSPAAAIGKVADV